MDGPCFVYLIGCKDGCGPTKIGVTGDLGKRLATVQTNCPFEAVLHASVFFPLRYLAVSIEQLCHQMLASRRLHGEWFDIDSKLAHQAVCAQTAGVFLQLGLGDEYFSLAVNWLAYRRGIYG